MSIADELDKIFEQRVFRTKAQGLMLRRLAHLFFEGFVAYVGANPNVWNKPNGKVGGQRVKLGEGQGDEFKPTVWTHLAVSLGAIEFSIAYTLSCRESGSAYEIIVPVVIRAIDDGYLVTFGRLDEEFLVSRIEDLEGRFDSVYAAIIEGLKPLVDPNSVILHKVK